MTAGEWIGNALWSLIPVAGVGLIVWIVFRAIVRADSKERKVYSEIEAEERAKRERRSAAVDALRETTTGADKAVSEQQAKKGK